MAEYITALDLTETPLASGERIVIELKGRWVAIFNISDRYYAIEDVCPHDGGPLAEGELDGSEIECSRHGARFDVTTGKRLTFPATRDVPFFLTRVEGTLLQVAM